MPGHLSRPLLALVVGAAALTAGCGDDSPASPPPAAEAAASPRPPDGQPAPEGIEGVVAVTGLTNGHTDGEVDYPTRPPLGGDHFPQWYDCDLYTEPIADEPAVHALEHGAVWIAYRPDAGEADLATLRSLVEGDGHILASPYPELRAPFVVTAWGRQLDLQGLDDPRLQQFIDAYVRAGDAPEPGAPCEGGIEP